MIDDAEAANSKKRNDHIGFVSRDDENEAGDDNNDDGQYRLGVAADSRENKRKTTSATSGANDIFSAAR